MVTLKALKGSDSKVALQRLARAVLGLLPSPHEQEGPTEPELMLEVYAALGIDPPESAMPPNQTARMMELLTGHILTLGGSEFDLESARDRLGSRAVLPHSAYRLTDSQSTTFYGFTANQVAKAIHEADDHYLLKLEGAEFQDQGSPFDHILLFTKKLESHTGSRFALTICAAKGAALDVRSALWVDSNMVDTRNIKNPLDLLRRFLRVYGRPVRFGNRPNTRLVVNEAGPYQGDSSPVITVTEYFNHNLDRNLVARLSPLGIIQVAMAFAVDVTDYELDSSRFLQPSIETW